MERVGFVMRVLPGREEEYRRRHEAVWPELLADLRAAGVETYSIFLRDDELFAYLEVADFGVFTRAMGTSDANARWQAEMADLIDPLIDRATGFHTRIPEVFHLE
jgi:L-rhamnose mutarotase